VADFLLARTGTLHGCLVLDIRLPGGPNGLELQKALSRQGETLPVIFLTGHANLPMGIQAMKDGAFDFLTKPIKQEDLLRAVDAALAREAAAAAARTRQRELAERAGQLSATEREVFRRVVAGQPNKQIAVDLDCSERTVKAHRAQVMSKMGATSLAELVQLAAQLGPEKE
jgi:FixJ family two-component response regulator